jgi:hypothetical protein
MFILKILFSSMTSLVRGDPYAHLDYLANGGELHIKVTASSLDMFQSSSSYESLGRITESVDSRS